MNDIVNFSLLVESEGSKQHRVPSFKSKAAEWMKVVRSGGLLPFINPDVFFIFVTQCKSLASLSKICYHVRAQKYLC